MAEAVASERGLLWFIVHTGDQQGMLESNCMSNISPATHQQPLLYDREDCTIAWLDLMEALASASGEGACNCPMHLHVCIEWW